MSIGIFYEPIMSFFLRQTHIQDYFHAPQKQSIGGADLSRPEACNFIKKETLAKEFPCEFCEISENTFSCRTTLVVASDSSPKKQFLI